MRHRGRFLNQDVERSSDDQFATASANLPSPTPATASPAQATAQSNPIDRERLTSPRGFLLRRLFGRQPSQRLNRLLIPGEVARESGMMSPANPI